MQIPNFQSYFRNTGAGNKIILSPSWFPFQRQILSEVYGDFKDRDAFVIYLYLCKHFDYTSKKTYRCIDTIHKDLKYNLPTAHRPKYSRKVQNALAWLEREGFIKRVSGKQQWFRSTILVAPDYHYGQQKFYSCHELNFDFDELKAHNKGYIMVPKTVLTEKMLADTTLAKRQWTITKLKTILLLYAYCWLEFYGGIDPRIVQIDQQGKVDLNPGFCYALKGSTTVISRTVISLIKDGLFIPVRCWFEEGIYTGDVGTYQPNSNAKVVERIVLRPTHLILHQVETDVMKSKKGYMEI
ncbi:hypothetical protein ACFSO0_11830 [Brevibacillus sp. GCM10020057]|uniref:hypothetical protein n=1 Tax=Brevibacillus sp. GCM10020057 TaxID=3317327 RepID=UPI00363B921E